MSTDDEPTELRDLLSESAGRRIKLLTLLEAVGTRRRSATAVSILEDALGRRGLEAWPPITVAQIDGEIELRKRGEQIGQDPAHETVPPASDDRVSTSPDATDDAAETATAGETPVRRLGLYVGNVLGADRQPESVMAQESPRNVLTRLIMRPDRPIMVFRDKAQRDLEGIVTWEAIVRHQLSHGFEEPSSLRAITSPIRVVREDHDLLPLVPQLMEEGHLGVMDSTRVIIGVLGIADLATHFIDRSRPYLMVGDIEEVLRSIISTRLGHCWDAIAAIEADAYAGSRRPTSPEDLTFSTYVRVLQSKEFFEILGWRIDRKLFASELDTVRDIRNDIMHFSPDPSPDAVPNLQRFLELLRIVEPQLVAAVSPGS